MEKRFPTFKRIDLPPGLLEAIRKITFRLSLTLIEQARRYRRRGDAELSLLSRLRNSDLNTNLGWSV